MTTVPVQLPPEAWEDVEPDVEALVENWLVREGDRVVKGQPLANVVLVKASYEVAAPEDGVVALIVVNAEETFAKDQPLAIIRP